jgi:hypothetical protein
VGLSSVGSRGGEEEDVAVFVGRSCGKVGVEKSAA